jgi:cbb3-type cytochrome oxidase subunit 3
MTEEEFKKAMTKTIIFIIIMIILLIAIAVLVFNKSGKSTSIFESDEQKASYENTVNEINSYNISEEQVNEIGENVNEENLENQVQEEEIVQEESSSDNEVFSENNQEQSQ